MDELHCEVKFVPSWQSHSKDVYPEVSSTEINGNGVLVSMLRITSFLSLRPI